MEKFADEAVIEVSSGAGGNGCASFRREKYVPKGGPSGGDGGRGGDVVFTIRRNLRTLAHLRHRHSFKAENGHDGQNWGCHGRSGDSVLIPLPPGSLIRDAGTGDLIRDFSAASQDFVFLKGGNGGWGNIHVKSSVNRAPRKALPGKPGQRVRLKVELQLIADIGLVGFPNAGKSSLLDRLTRARPKIAPYPFTTKIPNLGVMSLGSAEEDTRRDLILADIPGLIEGASQGAGLAIQFLKPISLTAALAFLIDLSDSNYLDAFDILLKELETFSPALIKKQRIIFGTKTDLPEVSGRLLELKAKYPDEQLRGISVFSGDGIGELAQDFVRLTLATEKGEAEE
jgi:GTP-binding protein